MRKSMKKNNYSEDKNMDATYGISVKVASFFIFHS